MNVVIFIAYTGSQFTNSPGTFFRSAAQIPLHKMYTFVYRTFIKFILFCRGQALDVPLITTVVILFFHSLDKLSWAITRCPLGLLLRLLCTKCILLFIELLQNLYFFAGDRHFFWWDRHWMSNLRFPVGRERSHIHRLHWKSIYQFTRHFFSFCCSDSSAQNVYFCL